MCVWFGLHHVFPMFCMYCFVKGITQPFIFSFAVLFQICLKTWAACAWEVHVLVSQTWDDIEHNVTLSCISQCHQFTGWSSSHCFSSSSLFSLFECWHHKGSWGMLGKWVTLFSSLVSFLLLILFAHHSFLLGPENSSPSSVSIVVASSAECVWMCIKCLWPHLSTH